MTERDRPQLDYGQAPSWHRRRSSRRVALLLFALIALGFGIRWGNFFIERVQANYWFARCMKYEVPKNQPAYSEPDGACLGLAAPEPWNKFSFRWGGSAPMSRGTIFLHERKPATGSSRLVVVDVVGEGDGRTLQIQSHVFEPPIGISPAKRKSAVVRTLAMPQDQGILQILNGIPDSLDPSHFTMNYTVGKRQGVLDGWLRDDDTVVIEPREEAATRPAPSSPATSR